MFEPKTLATRGEGSFLDPRVSRPPTQKRLMGIALALLLGVLGFVLYHDRDFWFPDTQEAEDQSQPAAPDAAATPHKHAQTGRKKSQTRKAQSADSLPAGPSSTPPVVAARTVLAPMEVEVIAGDYHRILHPNTNSVQVSLDPNPPRKEVAKTPANDNSEAAASVTTNAAERGHVSAATADLVTHTVQPGYPLLARQMKVQGSVVLQALIGRNGLIEDLHVISGPPILADAAQEAVKQWHFKPHYQGTKAVEAQARITVNFTISTN